MRVTTDENPRSGNGSHGGGYLHEFDDAAHRRLAEALGRMLFS